MVGFAGVGSDEILDRCRARQLETLRRTSKLLGRLSGWRELAQLLESCDAFHRVAIDLDRKRHVDDLVAIRERPRDLHVAAIDGPSQRELATVRRQTTGEPRARLHDV